MYTCIYTHTQRENAYFFPILIVIPENCALVVSPLTLHDRIYMRVRIFLFLAYSLAHRRNYISRIPTGFPRARARQKKSQERGRGVARLLFLLPRCLEEIFTAVGKKSRRSCGARNFFCLSGAAAAVSAHTRGFYIAQEALCV